MFILFDGRAHHDIDDAAVLTTAQTKKEAKKQNFDHGDGCIWYDDEKEELRYDWYNEWNKK